jgi:hypothetical protein
MGVAAQSASERANRASWSESKLHLRVCGVLKRPGASYILQQPERIRRRGPRFGFTASGPSAMIAPSVMGPILSGVTSRSPVRGLFFFRRSRRPLSQDPTPLSDRQARPRSPLAVASEQRLGLRGCCQRTAAAQLAGCPRSTAQLEEVAPVSDQGIVRLLGEGIVGPNRRLAQPASLNGSLFRSKRDRKIAASIGSWNRT